MVLRFNNAHFWRAIAAGGGISFPSPEPISAKTVVKATVPVVVWLVSIDGQGEVSEPVLVGYLPAGDSPIQVSHGCGFELRFEFAKAGVVSIYDDREETTVIAPVGESFTVFEKPGVNMEDPLQVLIHRDTVLRRLQAMADGPEQEDPRVQSLEEQLASLTKLVQEKFPETDGQAEEQQAE